MFLQFLSVFLSCFLWRSHNKWGILQSTAGHHLTRTPALLYLFKVKLFAGRDNLGFVSLQILFIGSPSDHISWPIYAEKLEMTNSSIVFSSHSNRNHKFHMGLFVIRHHPSHVQVSIHPSTFYFHLQINERNWRSLQLRTAADVWYKMTRLISSLAEADFPKLVQRHDEHQKTFLTLIKLIVLY